MKMDENYIAEQFKRADTFFKASKFAPALEILRELNGIFPGERKLLFPMARCLAELGQEGEALEVCEVILEKEDYEKARVLHDILADKQSGVRVDFASRFVEMDSDRPPAAATPLSSEPSVPTPPAKPQTNEIAVAEPLLDTSEPWFIVVVVSLLVGLLGFGFLATVLKGNDLVAFIPTTLTEVFLAGIIDILSCVGPLYGMLYLAGLLRKEGTRANILFACAGGVAIAAVSIATYLSPLPAWADDLVAFLLCSIYYRLPVLGVLGYWSLALWVKVGLWSLLFTSFAQACLSLI